MIIDPNAKPDENGNVPAYGFIIISDANPHLSFMAALGCALLELLKPIVNPLLFMWSWVRRKPIHLLKVQIGEVSYAQIVEQKRQQEAAQAKAKKDASPIVQP